MLRAVLATVLMADALVASASEPKHSVDGAWIFDNAPSYPAVTMLNVRNRAGAWRRYVAGSRAVTLSL